MNDANDCHLFFLNLKNPNNEEAVHLHTLINDFFKLSQTFKEIDLKQCTFVAKVAMLIFAYQFVFSEKEKSLFEKFLSKKSGEPKIGQDADKIRRQFDEFFDLVLAGREPLNWEKFSKRNYIFASWKDYLNGQAESNEDLYAMSFLFTRDYYVEEKYEKNVCLTKTLIPQRIVTQHLPTLQGYCYVCTTEPSHFPADLKFSNSQLDFTYQNCYRGTFSSLFQRPCRCDIFVSFYSLTFEVPKAFEELCQYIPNYTAKNETTNTQTDSLLDTLLIKIRSNESDKFLLKKRVFELARVLFRLTNRKIQRDLIVSYVLLMENPNSWFLLYDCSPHCFKECIFRSNCLFQWPLMVPISQSGISKKTSIELHIPPQIDQEPHAGFISTKSVAFGHNYGTSKTNGDEIMLENVLRQPIKCKNLENRSIFEFHNPVNLCACLLIHVPKHLVMPVEISIQENFDDAHILTIASTSGKEAYLTSSPFGNWYIISLRKRSFGKNSLLYQVASNHYLNPLYKFQGFITQITIKWPAPCANTDDVKFYFREQSVYISE